MSADLQAPGRRGSAARSRRAGDRGASMVEYGAVLLLISAVVAALVSVALPERVSSEVKSAICKIFQGDDCGDTVGARPGESTGGDDQLSGRPGLAGNTRLPVPASEEYLRQLCRELRMDCASWDPSQGLSCNDAQVVQAFEYYGDVSRQHPELQWAGMAKLAGGSVYAGMQDLHVLRKMTRDARALFLRRHYPDLPTVLLDALAGAAESELKYFESTLVDMNRQVFEEFAWQFEAYDSGGIEEMRRLARAGELPRGLIEAWEDIASGDPERIQRGNEEILWREQNIIIGDDYEEMKNHNGLVGEAVTYIISLTAESPIPGGRPFRDVVNTRIGTPEEICATPWGPCQEIPSVGIDVPDKNVADFESRWEWITEDMLPRYQELLEEDPDGLREEIDRSLADRADDYRLFPVGYDPNDGVC